MLALAGGRQSDTDPETIAELARLRGAAAQANGQLMRQRALLDQLDQQLAEARRHATIEGLAARQAERRVAELDHELALAHEELARLRTTDLARTDRVVAHVEDHHRSLLTSLRSDPDLIDATPGHDDGSTRSVDGHTEGSWSDSGSLDTNGSPVAVAGPTLLALQQWLTPDDAVAIIDGDALAAALARRTTPTTSVDAGIDAEASMRARRTATVATLHAALGPQAAKATIVFDGSLSAAAPDHAPADATQALRVLVTAHGVDVSNAVGVLLGRDGAGPVICIHEAVAAAGTITVSYRLDTDTLAEALTAATI